MLHNGVSILDWNYYETKARGMSEDQLRFCIDDCRQAIEAQKGIEGYYNDRGIKYSGFYEDERHVYVMELNKRKKAFEKKKKRAII